MAEALLRHRAGKQFAAFSAGIDPKGINPFTIHALDEIGVSHVGQYSKHVDQYLGKVNFDYLITVCDHAAENCPVFLGAGQRLQWSFDDPAAVVGSPDDKMQAFRRVRDQIDQQICTWMQTN
jgi:arsenate reductase